MALANSGSLTLMMIPHFNEAKQRCIINVCQPGRKLLAAGYCLYSSSVVFTVSIGKGSCLRQPGPPNGKRYSGRYISCLVDEIQRMLLYGGIYGNPKKKDRKNGNLRLLYECTPMSYVVEQAGRKQQMVTRESLTPSQRRQTLHCSFTASSLDYQSQFKKLCKKTTVGVTITEYYER
uniref:Fructose-1-6-bisphosphatase class 1 C-terminal domain-containing protein n=1 Tax=Populus trichocarpa TaxID=3694 RepID=A0A2K1ZZJ8_POPTR